MRRSGQRHSLGAHGGTGGLVEKRRRRLLDHFLVTALDGAFALAEVDDVAVRIGSTWISMWRGSSMNFSMKTRSSPNEERASELARAKPSSVSARS
jgi:hypothetical protein